ncbi:MAG: Gfo/Idh/MocA family oxidoreductase [Anaerolineae bacterium]|nr:Gfo/Idh/MocA family oxidoreductase [Anaerolineae bacterium]
METLRAVLVGCGAMSARWLEVANTIPALSVVGFVDINLAAAKARAAQSAAPNPLVTTNLEAALEQTTPHIVFDCTVPEAHAETTLAALRWGCHVLGEKPLADSLENARRMVQAAHDAGRLYAVVQNRRYDPNIRRLRRFLDSGAIGGVTTINSDFYIAPHFGGFRDQMQHVLLLDMAIHTLDAARYLANADPVSVYCKEWNPPGSWYKHGASAVAIFEMTGGLIYTYRGSWCAEGLPTTWESDWRIVGQSGSVSWHGDDQMRAQVVQSTGGFFSEHAEVDVPAWDVPERVGGHEGIIRDFVACVRSGDTPETTASDNIKSLAMVFAAIESAEQGRVVPVRWD